MLTDLAPVCDSWKGGGTPVLPRNSTIRVDERRTAHDKTATIKIPMATATYSTGRSTSVAMLIVTAIVMALAGNPPE